MSRLFLLMLICYLPSSFADTIYQWSDPWGQLQYSKTPVPGAMVSELTELPEVQEMTEEQKQTAMFRKLQEMKQADFLRGKKKSAEENLRQHRLDNQIYCNQLNNMLIDVQFRNATNFFYLGNLYHPSLLQNLIRPGTQVAANRIKLDFNPNKLEY